MPDISPIIRVGAEQIDDAARLFDSYRQFYGQAADLAGATRFVAERVERNDSAMFLALDAGEARGFTQLYPSFSSVAMRRIWILNDLFVAPRARGLGVARRLLRAATEFAAGDGAKRLVLATASDNHPARSLYEKSGWTRDAFFHYAYELEMEQQ